MKVAIVGSGQLARMLALAGWPLGFEFCFLVRRSEATSAVTGLGELVFEEDHASSLELYQALGQPEVITVEKEAVDTACLQALQQHCPVSPSPEMVAICRDRGQEKRWLEQQGAAVAPYRLTHNRQMIVEAAAEIGYPAILKTCIGGYDGYNQWRLDSLQEVMALDEAICQQACVLEGRVNFSREVSLLAVRSARGEIRTYPLTENHHQGGTLLTSITATPDSPDPRQQDAERIARRLLEASGYVGVLAIEFFVTEQGLVVNELAPRVHNSGHWTQLGCLSSQFDNHLRAIGGLPLGDTQARAPTGMINLLGLDLPPKTLVAEDNQVHWYGKPWRAKRKMGHINLSADSPQQLQQQIRAILQRLYPA